MYENFVENYVNCTLHLGSLEVSYFYESVYLLFLRVCPFVYR